MKKIYSLLLALCVAACANAQYCTPTCSNPSGGCTYGEVALFALQGVSSTLLDTLGCTGSGYENNTGISSMTTTINAGGTYTFTMGATFFDPRYSQVWIDFNNDSTFSSSETVGGYNGWASSSSTMSFMDTFTVPSGAYTGTVRMRFVNVYGGGFYYPSMNPCMGSSYSFGDARDYLITIAAASSGGCTSSPAGGTASVSSSTSCGHNTITLTSAGAATGSYVTYQWMQSTDGGSTWTAISGATTLTYTMAEPSVNTLYKCVLTCTGYTGISTTATFSINRISGHISYGATAPDTMSLKVWLIAYSASAGTLTAIDSQITCLDSLHPYYEFNGVATDTYKVKAQSLDATSSMVGASGFVPTYGTSSAHWSGGANTNHSGGSDVQNITMVYGTVPSGPGFIGGSVYSGAGKNTAADVPAVNMLVYLKNTASGILTQAYTDATGHYNFGSIAYGSYEIYPEAMAYTTTYASVTISASHAGESAVNFKQYTGSKTIKPIVNVVKTVTTTESFSVYPNPAASALNIKWTEQATGAANVVVTDITGREVFSSAIEMSNTSGAATISLPVLNNGMYFLKIKSGSVNFSEKLMIQH